VLAATRDAGLKGICLAPWCALWGVGGCARRFWRLRPGRKLFEFSADGVQIHVCKRKDQAQKEQVFSWVFEALEAVLFDAQATHAGTQVEGPASLT
jgi:hypothetical protein